MCNISPSPHSTQTGNPLGGMQVTLDRHETFHVEHKKDPQRPDCRGGSLTLHTLWPVSLGAGPRDSLARMVVE